MCIFTGDIDSLLETEIFARVEGERQFLVYKMTLATSAETAMILPLPVATPSREDSVRFISLEAYPEFFDDLRRAFPSRRDTRSLGGLVPSRASLKTLEVRQVGSFEASFAPKLEDLSRADPRFRLPTEIWEALPAYRDYGFAIFKLRPGSRTIHPMAFDFPTRSPHALFFPTVHVHHRELRESAEFDHNLYAQGEISGDADWTPSSNPLGSFVRARGFLRKDPTQGIVDPGAFAFRLTLKGTYKNRDTWVSLGS